jgi:hypothetical protein
MLRRKMKKRSPVRMRLPEILRKIAWPIGERREIKLWADACALYPLFAFVAVFMIVISWNASTPTVWIRMFVNNNSPAEVVLYKLICRENTISWDACNNTHILPFALAFVVSTPALIASNIG